MFRKEKIKTLQVLSALIAISAIAASVTGIVCPDIYKPIVLFEAMSFVFVQDLISLVAAVLLLIMTFFGNKENIKLNIIRTAIIGYMFYAYGMYAMGSMYNYLYFLYLAIFGLSIFYFINAFTGIEYEKLDFDIPRSLRLFIAIFCAVTPIIFAPQWIILVMQWVHDGSRPDGGNFNFFVSLPIFDLCFILPVFALTSIYLFQKKILGIFLAGILTVKIFTLFINVSLGYLSEPLFQNTKLDMGNSILYSAIAIVCLVLSIFYFVNVKITKVELK